MTRVNEGLEYKDFDKPSGIVTATVCKKSGKLAVAGVCDRDPRGNQVYTEYFAAGTAPTEICDHHVQATICTESGKIANEFCPEEYKQTGIYIIGGSSNTDDGPYLLSEELANSICDIHTSATSILDKLDDIGDIFNNDDTDKDKDKNKDKDKHKDNEDEDTNQEPDAGSEGGSDSPSTDSSAPENST